MGKVIALGPGGRAQAPVRDDRCRGVIDAVVSGGLLDRRLLSPACATMAAAEQLRLAMYRSARYYCSCGRRMCTRKNKNTPPDDGCPRGGHRVSCQADVVRYRNRGKWELRIEFTIFDKREAM